MKSFSVRSIFVIFLLAAAASLAVFLVHGYYFSSPDSQKQVSPSHSIVLSSPKSSPSPTAAVEIPAELSIPRLGVDTRVEQVGLDSQNRMDVPKQVDDVGWYNLGYKPGEKGNAVIDGHYDKVDGSPAVFYYISSLQNGDKIYVTDESNRRYDFKVSNVVTYPYDQLPLQDIFAGHSSSQLILITCSGIWDQGTHNYSTRTVVYALLKEQG